MESIASHTLSMSPGYVSHWGIWEACRELLQNALDQADRNADSAVVFEYDRGTELLTIGATNCHLDPRTLLLGETDKSCDTSQRGRFGEGYKLAILVFVRMGYDVVVRNGTEVWKASFEWSDDFGCSVLQVARFKTYKYENGVWFDIRPDAIERSGGENSAHVREFVAARDKTKRQDRLDVVFENYIPDVPLDTILREDHFNGRVFSGGLFVCKLDGLQWGYNFSPGKITLNRDRDMPSTFDVTWHASKLWQASGDREAVYDSVSKGQLDTQYLEFDNPDMTAYAARRFAEESEGAVPVSTYSEGRELEEAGHRTRQVPRQLCDAIRSVEKFDALKKDSPRDRLLRFDDEHMQELADETSIEWQTILEAAKRWTGPAY